MVGLLYRDQEVVDSEKLEIVAKIPPKFGFDRRVMVHPDLLLKAANFLEYGTAIAEQEGKPRQKDFVAGARICVDNVESVSDVIKTMRGEQYKMDGISPSSGAVLEKIEKMRDKSALTFWFSCALVVAIWLATIGILGRHEVLAFGSDFRELSRRGLTWGQIRWVAIVPVWCMILVSVLVSGGALSAMPDADQVRIVFYHLSQIPGEAGLKCNGVFNAQLHDAYRGILVLGVVAAIVGWIVVSYEIGRVRKGRRRRDSQGGLSQQGT